MKTKLLTRMAALLLMLLCASIASAQEKEAYAVINYSTMTFYYNADRSTYEQNCDVFVLPVNFHRTWSEYVNDFSNIVFDESFKDVRPTYTASWFSGCNYVQDISGLEYLNTSEVTDMHSMFQDCYYLTSLDLSTWDTGKVNNMKQMFATCLNLGTIYA